MEESKSIKKSTAIILVALSIVLSVVASIVCSAFSAGATVENNVDTVLENANNSVKEFSNSLAYNTFEFSNALYAKANTVAIAVDEKSADDELTALAKDLNLNSFALTDADGKIVAAHPAELKSTNIADNSDFVQFRKNLKGITAKSISQAKPVDGADGTYTIMAAVPRSEGGIVIVDAVVDNYHIVSGENIADECCGDTVIAKGDVIVSSNIDIGGKASLKEIGVDEGKIGKGIFKLDLNGREYKMKANKTGDYTVISGVPADQSAQDYMLTAIIPIIAGAVIFVIMTIIIIFLSKNKQA